MAQNAVLREKVHALRETIAAIEDRQRPAGDSLIEGREHGRTAFREGQVSAVARALKLGIPAFDAATDGGVPLQGLTEIRSAGTRQSGAATGFVLALAALRQKTGGEDGAMPVLWIGQGMAAREAGLPYPAGLKSYGIDTDRFLIARPEKVDDALWIAEAALGLPAFAAIILEVRGNPIAFGLAESRRLHVKARDGGLPILILRQAGEEEASSARLRLRISPGAASPRPLPGGGTLSRSLGQPVFEIAIEKSRLPQSKIFTLEWNADDCRFDDAAAHDSQSARPLPAAADRLAGPAAPAGRSGGAVALGHVVAFERAS